MATTAVEKARSKVAAALDAENEAWANLIALAPTHLPEYKWLATEADRHGPLHKADDAHTAAYKRRHAANLALTRALSAAGQR